jgi:hypothetical protein
VKHANSRVAKLSKKSNHIKQGPSGEANSPSATSNISNLKLCYRFIKNQATLCPFHMMSLISTSHLCLDNKVVTKTSFAFLWPLYLPVCALTCLYQVSFTERPLQKEKVSKTFHCFILYNQTFFRLGGGGATIANQIFDNLSL